MEEGSMRCSSRNSITSAEDAAERESSIGSGEYPPGSPASKSHHRHHGGYAASVSSDEGRASVRSVRTFRASNRRSSSTAASEPLLSSGSLSGFQPFRGTSLDLSSSSFGNSIHHSHEREISAVSDDLSWTPLDDRDVSFKSGQYSSSGSLCASSESDELLAVAKIKDLSLSSRREAEENKRHQIEITTQQRQRGYGRSRWPQPNRAPHHSPAAEPFPAANLQKTHSSELYPFPSPADSPSCCHSNGEKQDTEGEKMKKKTKKRASRRHCRPVLGGAHLITCYECLALIQMPEDFHFSARTTGKLRCGSCGKVLIYSIVGGKHVVPRNSVADAPSPPPPAVTSKEVGAASCASTVSGGGGGGGGQGNQESYTEESGPPFSSVSSIETEFELIARQQAEEQPPLHRLMGYVSARDIMFPL